MNPESENSKKQMIKLAIGAVILFVIAMGGMLYYSANKTVTLNPGEDVLQMEVQMSPSMPKPTEEEFDLQKALNSKNTVIIDCNSNKSSDILIEGISLAEIVDDICITTARALTGEDTYGAFVKDINALLEDINCRDNIVYVGITFVESPDGRIIARYNQNYVIPGFENPKIADGLVRGLSHRTNAIPYGIFPSDDEDILALLKVPAARLEISISPEAAITTALSTSQGRENYGKAIAASVLDLISQKTTEDNV